MDEKKKSKTDMLNHNFIFKLYWLHTNADKIVSVSLLRTD